MCVLKKSDFYQTMSKYLEENFVLNLILDRQKKLANMQVFKGEKFSIDAVVLSSNLRTIVLSYDSLPVCQTAKLQMFIGIYVVPMNFFLQYL